MLRIVFGLLFVSFGLFAADKPYRSSQDKLRAVKALQAVKAFTGSDGKLLGESVLIDIGLIDRLSRDEEENLTRISEILLAHMLPDKPPALAIAAGQSLYSILHENTPTPNDYPALKAHLALEREWAAKVLGNKSLRDLASFQQYLVVKPVR